MSVPEVDVSPVGSPPMPSIHQPLSGPYPADVPQQAVEGKAPSFVPRWLAGVALALSGVLVAAAAVLPAPWGGVATALGLIAAFLAGAPLEVPRFAEGRPLVGPALAPALGSACTAAAGIASALPEGPLKSCALLAAVVLAVLAGKSFPLAKGAQDGPWSQGSGDVSGRPRQRAERGSMKAAFTVPVPDGWTGEDGFIASVAAAAKDPNGSATVRRLLEDEAKRLGVPIPKR